jgi:hypothetical protein
MTPGFQEWQVTLGRKKYSSAFQLDETGEMAREIVARANQHGAGTARKHYELSSGEASAMAGKAASESLLGTGCRNPRLSNDGCCWWFAFGSSG